MTEEPRSTVTCYPTVHNTVKIFAVLTGKSCRRESREHGMRPTEYKRQMLMCFQERIGHLLKANRSIDVRSLSDRCESQCFEVSPRILLFQQFAPGNVYNTTLTIRNVTKASRHLNISRHPDPFFSVEHNGTAYSSVIAPGLVHVYNVRFRPTMKRDYEYRVEFVSDVEVFAVPVIAIGPRPILDIPDRIEIPATAVKIPSSKTIAVRNVGDAPAIFNFCVNNSCFSVEPSKGTLGEGETMQLTAEFSSEKSGDHEAHLFLNYESGEKCCLTMRSSAINCTIQIDCDSIRMEETYLGLSRSKILTIHNRSDYVVRFQWMRFKDKDTDTQQREEYQRLFHLVYNMEVARHVNLVYYNICLPDIHELVCQRIYSDEIASLKNENFRYNHVSFLLIPESGEIWSQSSADITVIFRAVEMGEISSAAYLEVTGREDRIPLSLRATGKGPVLHLNVITIDFKNIFLCSVHNYEIVAANKGHICGTLIYKARPTDFGGTVNVTPSALTLRPNEHKSFNLSFSSNRKGDFVERVDFVIKESLEVVSLHVKGCIICPTLHFDKSIIDFGVTALGFSKGQQVRLRNLSLVPVSFSVSVMEDGDQASITHEEFARSATKPSFPSSPREFTIDPRRGVVQAHSSRQLKMTYTANVVRSGRSIIRVDMWDTDSDPIILPICFCGVIPSLSISPREISIRFCFINFPYSRSITVENKSELDGYFCIIPQTVSEEMPVVYSLSCYQSFLKARQSTTIDISIVTKVLGKQTTMLNMLTMGQQAPVAACSIICNGQGPIISVQPTCLNFGETEVLQKRIMSFRIINDSPISAQFKMTLSKKNSPWLVEPSSGVVGPNESTEIEVEIFLRDAGRYTGNIIVQVLHSRSISINLIATGIGCSIVFEPQIFPIFDIGFLFSHQDQSLPITMKNHGTHPYQIIWSNEPEVRIQRSHSWSTGKFRVEPITVDVPASGSNIVQCKIRWDINEVLTEDWYVFRQIYGKGKREFIGISTFKAVFTKPQIVFNKKELIFRIDMYPEEEDSQETDELVVTNQSQLNLNVQLYVKSPFYLITDQKVLVCKKKIVLTSGTTTTIPVKFLPDINLDNPYSRSYSGVLWFEYDQHPNKDKIRCRGGVNFPNVTLLCKDLTINCVSGSSAEETLRITNNGPVPVTYKFLWAGESIDIQRDVHDVEDFMDRSKLEINTESRKSTPRLYRNRESSATRENGDESTKIFAASTSALHVLQKSKLDELLGKLQSETLDETLEKLRSIFPPTNETLCLSCLKNPEVLALVDPDFEFPKESLNDILDIVPHEGTLPPYSSQRVRFTFHGSEPMQVKAIALCEIFQGPTEVVNVFARADIVQYAVDRRIIDFGQQLYGEQCRSSFTLENRSRICLSYEINERDLVSGTEKSGSAISALTVEPNKGFLDPLSSMKITIEFQPTVLGAFEIEFELQMAHADPLILIARGVTGYPQIYPCILRDDIFEQHSVEFGYQAIQLLTSDYIAMKKREIKVKCNDANNELKNQMHGWNEKILLDDGWDLIDMHEEMYPSIIDIEMAIDRFLAARFVQDDIFILSQHSIPHRSAVIPSLNTASYIIDMSYVPINLQTCHSTTIINYGPWDTEVSLGKLQRKRLENSGILVQFSRKLLTVGETAILTVTWQPISAKYAKRSTEEKHLIYLQVARGSTVPIIVKGIITYPFVTVNTKLLDFQKVIVGECLMMTIVVKNEGFVDCCWEATVESTTRRRQEDCPFHLSVTSNLLPVSCSDVIRVYFKPRKTCRAEAALKIIVIAGLETQTVTLLGRGIERKLHISETNITFPTMTPFTGVQERVLTVENARDYPVELSWHHLDSLFLEEEERLAEALTRYYGVEEILLPPRELGERMPTFLMEFYNSLVSEMAYSLSAEAIEKESVVALNGEDESSDAGHEDRARITKKSSSTSGLSDRQSSTRQGSQVDPRKESNRKRKKPRHLAASLDFARKDCPPMAIVSELDFPREPPTLPTRDPEEIQRLLLCYIETLRKDVDFAKRMKDPVKELFDSLKTKSIPQLGPLLDSPQPAKKVCIIFHGAPFTEYQETACRSAKVLQVPLLLINNIIIEGIALGNHWFSIKIRQIIDAAYEELLSTLEKHKDISKIVLPATKTIAVDGYDEETIVKQEKKSLEQTDTQNEITKFDSEAITEIHGYIENDIASLEELIIPFEGKLVRIPREQDLKSLDPVSIYEYKIQGILLLQKILPRFQNGVGSTKEKTREKDTKKHQDDTFLEIEVDLLTEVLRDRLLSPDFKSGFVLQTLNNIFFKNDITTLLTLLNIVGHVEYSLFVTFLNSMDNYTRKMEEMRELKEKELAEEINKKIQRIDEMSLSEYELLDEDDRKFYLESTLPIKRQEALERQMRFAQRMTEMKGKKKSSQQLLNIDIIKNKKINKRIKNRKIDHGEEKSPTSIKPSTNKEEIHDHEQPQSRDIYHPRDPEILKKLEDIANAMNDYYSNLSAIENILKNWDPLKKDVLFTAKSIISKIDKPKDKFSEVNKETNTSEFHIWYVNATDPWNRIMYDVVVSQMRENSLARNALPTDILPKLDLEPKKYYIFKPRKIRKQDIARNGAYQIVSLSNSTIMTINSSHTNISKQENHMENARNRKNLHVVDKIENNTSLNTIDSEDTNASNINAIFERTLKPRWILQSKESQRFKIRYQPEEVGFRQQTYTLSIIDGSGITYDINVYGIVDIPRLDMNPNIIFPKVKETKVEDNIIEPTYFSDTGIFDFGSLLVFRKDKSVHRREVELKFCNISKIDAEVYFYLQGDNVDIFSMDLERLCIKAGECKLLKISAGVTKLGSFTDKLYVCTTNNPHVDTIELECSGAKLDIELESKQLSFGQVLLYRKNSLTCVMRNRSPVEIFWQLHPDGTLEPQISFTPINGVIKAWSDRKIEFCYHASKIGVTEATFTFKAFFHEGDVESIFTDTLTLSGETYEVAVDVSHANPIDLKDVRVGFPTSADFTISNRGNHEIRYVVLLEEKDKLTKIASSLFKKLKKQIEINPASGSIQPQKEAIVQVTFTPKNEIILKKSPILRCHILDMNKQAAVVAEFPLTVSSIAYYTRFHVYPYPEINFGSLGVCTQQTMHLNIKNTGQFPLHYSIRKPAIVKHPSEHSSADPSYVTQIKMKDAISKDFDKMTDTSTRKDMKSSQRKTTERTTALKIGAFTLLRTEGDVRPGETDVVTIQCYPELAGAQEEEMTILVPDTVPEERDKLIKLSVNSCVPSVDFQDLDAIFRESHIVDRIEDFAHPKDIGAHTVFARQEKCLYLRYVKVSNAHSTGLVLCNRNAVPVDVKLTLLANSFVPETVQPDFLVLAPERERIPPMDQRRFTVSFNPTSTETCYAVVEITVELPPHFKCEKLSVKLIGQACLPEVEIVQVPMSEKQEKAVLNFGRTLVNDSNGKKFAFTNVGVIVAQVIAEIHEDPNSLFTLGTHESTRNVLTGSNCEGANERCVTVRLIPEEMILLEIKFTPREIGKYNGQLRLFVVDNPDGRMMIDLMGEAYSEIVVLEGLELADIKYNFDNEKRESDSGSQRSSEPNSIMTVSTPFPILLAYKLDYGYCFVNEVYRKSFKISNKSTNSCLRFQWNAHSNITFSPSVGHLKPLTSKKIIATFLSPKPANYIDMCLYCMACVIELTDLSRESSWDDRETEVRWTIINSDNAKGEIKAETYVKKIVEPVNEPSHEIVPETTKYLQVLLNAIVTFPE